MESVVAAKSGIIKCDPQHCSALTVKNLATTTGSSLAADDVAPHTQTHTVY
jgi:hypothetical protein